MEWSVRQSAKRKVENEILGMIKYTNHINFYSKSVRIGDFILSRSVRLYKRGLVSYFVGSIWRSPSGFFLIKLENHMQQVLHEFRSL